METQDPEAFSSALGDFERINPLDDWKVQILLRAKEAIEEEPSLA